MAGLPERIKQVRKIARLSQEAFAKAIGDYEGVKVSRGAVGNWELGGGISRAHLTAISVLFGVSLDWLERGTGEVPNLEQPVQPRDVSLSHSPKLSHVHDIIQNTPSNARVGDAVSLITTIPVYGQAMGGKYGEFALNGNKVAEVLAPVSLQGVANAYAVYVAGDSMEERYFAGEVVYVHPGLPVSRNHFVVAQIATDDGSAPLAFVKKFISFDDRRLKLQQLNPKKIIEFPSKLVVSVHRIVMGGEG
jgi:phage repressor protein C with HTH and peptisase S24 domain